MLQNLLFIFLPLLAFALHVRGQTGFISIDCGMEQTSYNDSTTGIFYTGDSPYIETGVNRGIADPSLPKQYQTVRSFPAEKRNCYSLEGVSMGDKYLIRASFMYANYDKLNSLPEFDIYLGIDLWFGVKFDNSSHRIWSEIITVATSTRIAVCLVNRDSGIPFMSMLEFRRFRAAMYKPFFDGNVALVTRNRVDVGSSKELRYPPDLYDRIWAPDSSKDDQPHLKSIGSKNYINGVLDTFDVPMAVMQTAIESNSSKSPIDIGWSAEGSSSFHIIIYFSELEAHNNSRQLNLYKDGQPWGAPFVPPYANSFGRYSSSPLSGRQVHPFSIRTTNGTLAPILNAYEVYEIKQLSGSATSFQDVLAIMDIKRRYRVEKNWMGDPCLPLDYIWDGLSCDYGNAANPRISSLDLSRSNLTGEISDFISKLTAIQSINLANNSLEGIIPDSLGDLPNLGYLNLEGNQLNGTIPPTLEERVHSGRLILRVDNQVVLPKKMAKHPIEKLVVAIAVPTVVSIILILLVTSTIKLKRRNRGSLLKEETTRIFTYKEVVSITKDFQSAIGEGGSGTVYHGCLKNGREVAVKVLAKSVSVGPKEFSAEVKMLMTIHHRYLVSFIGFCEEGGNMILIYEYMSYGNLRDLLSGNNNKLVALTWEQRLRIALTIAQGLEYLHYGCEQPIIHRDLKTANILLNESLEAKIADFGLSKVFPSESMTHITTAVGGTHGYLDPEYHVTNRLTYKSDVYSFGTVLLELITGRPAIIRLGEERLHILQWVMPMIHSGDIESMVDPLLEGDYNTNSVWKVAEISISCMAQTAIMRPTISQVVGELKEAMDLSVVRVISTSLEMELKLQLGTSGHNSLFDIESLNGPSVR